MQNDQPTLRMALLGEGAHGCEVWLLPGLSGASADAKAGNFRVSSPRAEVMGAERALP